ncbi:hypothetical protein KEM56_002242 [Ascosphaera pollenicola]|nr:hypothetical protein KEM56_002242 [Ascosphaera pollenicola]
MTTIIASPQSASIRALCNLSKHGAPRPWAFRRSLHITGVKSAQPAKGIDTAAVYSSRSTSELMTECEKRGLLTSGNNIELANRLANHDQLQSRAFSIAMKRIEHASTFRTTSSRPSHSVPTATFAFMSHLKSERAPTTNMRIPIFSDNLSDQTATKTVTDSMAQKIYTVAGRTNEVASPSIVIDHPVDPFSPSKEAEQGGVSSFVKDFWKTLYGGQRASSSVY